MAHPTAVHPTTSTSTIQLPTTMGLDISDQVSHFLVQRGDGVQLAAGKVKMTREHLRALFQSYAGCRLVIEASGHSPWVSRLAAQCGMQVVVANARKLELISKNDKKSDRVDARLLTELGRTNPALLSPITHRSELAQTDLAVLRSRDELVRARTSFVNHVRGVLKTSGNRAPSCATSAFTKKASAVIPAELHSALAPLLEVIDSISERIARMDEQIEHLCSERYPVTKLLRRIQGVGPIVALSFVLTIDDPKRFRSARDVGAYLGLVPRRKSSGQSDPQMRITKAGDRDMRRLLVNAAAYVLGHFGPDCDLRRFGERMVREGGSKNAKKRARVAVARKLAVLMHHLWRTGEVYDPLYLAKKRGELGATTAIS
jgi:transposase